MDIQDYTISNYKSLALRGLDFSTLAYKTPAEIKSEIARDSGLELVWGPVQLSDWGFFAYAAMYAVRVKSTNSIWVTIRGTNKDSLWSWFYEDFAVGRKANLYHLHELHNKHSDIWVSQGTFLGMSYLTNMRDPITNLTLVQCLSKTSYARLYVTGHSLGGTLSPPLFVYLNQLLNGGGAAHNMALFTYAGLTPGGKKFNALFDKMCPWNSHFDWRFHNSLDIAPYMWESFNNVKNVYAANDLYYLYYGAPGIFIRKYFHEADDLGIGYAQPQTGHRLTGMFDTSFIDEELWSVQAAHQHGTATYRSLISAQIT